MRTHAIVAVVISALTALSCYVSLGGIPALILSIIALTGVEYQPDRSRRLLKWAWISIGINVALLIGLVVWLIVYGASGGFDTPPDYN
ncbi:hypothetical protein D5H75_34560 [Bailinhaonella thermotolerans]|uniref:DUF4190 domain-containing protein n=1 Tax=Bailinhaonella thermotolerans TaxID=1070861 RepID=A0A3A4A4N6_9ACTN|nr:hypothetical protein D5H75_34560 [Bailinhaonella thermotolerans]